jgi:type I restriction enzyme R subunit
VLNYFKDAKILGLTATPTPEAHAYFNKNIVEEYTYDHSVVDGVNVPARVYRIKTSITGCITNLNSL